jgi:hypothetical protein
MKLVRRHPCGGWWCQLEPGRLTWISDAELAEVLSAAALTVVRWRAG